MSIFEGDWMKQYFRQHSVFMRQNYNETNHNYKYYATCLMSL